MNKLLIAASVVAAVASVEVITWAVLCCWGIYGAGKVLAGMPLD